MTAVQMLGQAQEDTQDPHDVLGARVECSKFRVSLAGQSLALVSAVVAIRAISFWSKPSRLAWRMR